MHEMFTCEIRCEGAAFADQGPNHVAELLEKIAAQLRDGVTNKTHSVMDYNGNRCGSFKFAEAE